MSRKRGPVETPEYGQMVRRMVRSYGVRVGNADPEDLAEMAKLAAEVDQAITTAVRMQRATWGRSWSEIGRSLGITKQAAQQRFGSVELDQERKAS